MVILHLGKLKVMDVKPMQTGSLSLITGRPTEYSDEGAHRKAKLSPSKAKAFQCINKGRTRIRTRGKGNI